MSDHQDHWFDGLSARHTRRGALKAALAGGAALTLPLIRTNPALADDPHACQKGCVWTAQQRFQSALNGCDNLGAAQGGLTVGGYALGGAIFAFYAPTFGLAYLNGRNTQNRCRDYALLQEKAAFYECTQPDCPGFDPKASGGPCDTCNPPNICCPDQKLVQGYGCCTVPGGCCKADGCHSGTTDCGG